MGTAVCPAGFATAAIFSARAGVWRLLSTAAYASARPSASPAFQPGLSTTGIPAILPIFLSEIEHVLQILLILLRNLSFIMSFVFDMYRLSIRLRRAKSCFTLMHQVVFPELCRPMVNQQVPARLSMLNNLLTFTTFSDCTDIQSLLQKWDWLRLCRQPQRPRGRCLLGCVLRCSSGASILVLQEVLLISSEQLIIYTHFTELLLSWPTPFCAHRALVLE